MANRWQTFNYKSNSGRYFHHSNNFIYYDHWLPPKKKKEDMTEVNADLYQPFDTLIHATSLKTAHTIIKEGLKPQLIKDSSVVNPSMQFLDVRRKPMSVPNHPLSNKPVLWYGPCTKTEIGNPVDRYGNVTFTMKTLSGYEGIRRHADEFKYYFIEQIDYLNQSACRILVTLECYPELQEYDPTVKGGPWYTEYDESDHSKENPKDYYLTTVINSSGTAVKNSLEFMREQRRRSLSMWLRNHGISYTECINPRHGVQINRDSNSSDVDMNRLKLVLGILTVKMYGDASGFPFGVNADVNCLKSCLKSVHDEALVNQTKSQLKNDMFNHFNYSSREHLHEGILYRTLIQQSHTISEEMPVVTKYILSLFDSKFFESDGNPNNYDSIIPEKSLLNIYRNMLGLVQTGKETEFYDELCKLIDTLVN